MLTLSNVTIICVLFFYLLILKKKILFFFIFPHFSLHPNVVPSIFCRTFSTFLLQPSQWIETLKTHVCKNQREVKVKDKYQATEWTVKTHASSNRKTAEQERRKDEEEKWTCFVHVTEKCTRYLSDSETCWAETREAMGKRELAATFTRA